MEQPLFSAKLGAALSKCLYLELHWFSAVSYVWVPWDASNFITLKYTHIMSQRFLLSLYMILSSHFILYNTILLLWLSIKLLRKLDTRQ